MTDGTPSDATAYGEAVKAIRGRGFGSIIACAVGPKAGHEHLKQLTDKVVSLETLDSTAFAGFFKWVSASVSSGSTSAGINNGTDTLPSSTRNPAGALTNRKVLLSGQHLSVQQRFLLAVPAVRGKL